MKGEPNWPPPHHPEKATFKKSSILGLRFPHSSLLNICLGKSSKFLMSSESSSFSPATTTFLSVVFFIENVVFFRNKIRKNTKSSRSRRPEVFCKKDALRNFPKFTGKHLCLRLFFNKVADLRSSNFIKRESQAQVFSCEFCEIFKNTFFYRTLPVAAPQALYLRK